MKRLLPVFVCLCFLLSACGTTRLTAEKNSQPVSSSRRETESSSVESSMSSSEESVSESAPEATPEPTDEPTPEPTPDPTPEPTPEATPETTEDPASETETLESGTLIGSSSGSPSGSSSSAESEIIRQINELRQSLGLGTLTLNTSLQSAARIRANEFASYGLRDHVRPDGRSWETVLDYDVPVPYLRAAENVAGADSNRAGFTGVSPSEFMDMWINSPSHYAAMVEPTYTDVGVGVVNLTDSDGVVHSYAVTLFCCF